MGDQSMTGPRLLVLEPEGSGVIAAVHRAAGDTGAEVVVDNDLEAALAVGARERATYQAVVLNVGNERGAARVATVRSMLGLTAIPIVGVATELNDLVFEDALLHGVDDCCSTDKDALVRLMRSLSRVDVKTVALRDERVVVADPQRDQRLLVARTFRNAGFDVCFAEDAAEAVREVEAGRVAVVVCTPELGREAAASLSASSPAEQPGRPAVWIVNTPPKQISETRTHFATTGLPHAVHDAFSPPANLLFVANDLMYRTGTDARRSERLLYGTAVTFRPAGGARGHVGYCYNISAGGLYVRTLAPPNSGDEVWLELVPARSDRRVHVDARVVWARGWGGPKGATVPPGFGVEIQGMTTADALRYGRGYEAFLIERGAKV